MYVYYIVNETLRIGQGGAGLGTSFQLRRRNAAAAAHLHYKTDLGIAAIMQLTLHIPAVCHRQHTEPRKAAQKTHSALDVRLFHLISKSPTVGRFVPRAHPANSIQVRERQRRAPRAPGCQLWSACRSPRRPQTVNCHFSKPQITCVEVLVFVLFSLFAGGDFQRTLDAVRGCKR